MDPPPYRLALARGWRARAGRAYHAAMNCDDHVCLCFRVSKRKIVNYYRRERPKVASLINRELPAGTGCGWCVPYLERLHQQVLAGEPDPDLPVDPETYAAKRRSYRETGQREPGQR